MSPIDSNGPSSQTFSYTTPNLTVIIPAYNEEDRITETLQKYQAYFEQSTIWRDRTTILVVDDGSIDQTVAVVGQFEKQQHDKDSQAKVRCISLEQNGGKGAALALGIEETCRPSSSGSPSSLILTADADGSAEIDGVQDMYLAMIDLLMSSNSKDEDYVEKDFWNQPAIVSGFRTYDRVSAARLFFRWGFRSVVRAVCGDLRVQDSQCGFKLMTTSAARQLYSGLNLSGWSHDVEVLYRANLLRIPVSEVAILWEDKDGSKLVASPGGVIAVSAKMFWEVLRLRIAYETKVWS